MVLSGIGEIVWNEWIKTPEIRPDMNLEMVEFIVMPNHIHGIIYIGKNEFNNGDGGGGGYAMHHRDAMHRRDAMHGVSTTTTTTEYQNKFAPQRKNLSSIIRGFKSAVTKNSRLLNTTHGVSTNFAWQSRFHDRIIRDEQELIRIRKYIINNPQMWERNRNNQGLWL